MKLLTLSHKEKSIYFTMNDIEVNLSQDEIHFINDIYQREVPYWKKAAIKKAARPQPRTKQKN